jgi:hypothetical protein
MTMSFSQAILAGLQLRGLLLKDVKKTAEISLPTLNAISAGRREFTTAQLAKIEEFSGRTAGQLAASTLKTDELGLTQLYDQWAEFNHLVKNTHSSASRTKQRATARRNHKSRTTRVSKLVASRSSL